MKHRPLPTLLQSHWPLFLTFIALALALILAAMPLLTQPAPTGDDFYYHLEYAQEYAQNPTDLGHLWSVFWNSPKNAANNGPYPPLFHLLLVPFVLASGPTLPLPDVALAFGLFLELLMYPLAIGLTSLFAYKHKGPWAAALVAVLLVSSIAVFDRGAQPTPQAIDMVAFPLAALALLWKPKPKKALFVITSAVAVYSHGAYALLFLGGLVLFFLHKIVEEHQVSKSKRKSEKDTRERFALVWHALYWSLPLILVLFSILPAQLQYASKINNAQEGLIVQDPLWGVWYAGAWIAALGLPALVYFAWKRVWIHRKQTKGKQSHDFEWLSACWLVGLLPMLFAFPDRFASYAAVPLSLLAGWFLTDTTKRMDAKKREFTLTLFFFAILATGLAFAFFSWWETFGLP